MPATKTQLKGLGSLGGNNLSHNTSLSSFSKSDRRLVILIYHNSPTLSVIPVFPVDVVFTN